MYIRENDRNLVNRLILIAVVTCALLAPVPVIGQSTYGGITGTVTDPSGAVVAGVKVEALNQGTGEIHAGTTDAEGNYRFLNLDPGSYTITVSNAPFVTQKNQNVTLLARQIVRSDFRLQLSGTATEVQVVETQEVVAEVPAQSNSLSGLEINSLALNFRATNNTSPLSVAVLSPGVQTDQAGNVSISGGLPNSTSFSIDGVSTQLVRSGGPNRDLFPSVESMAEFQVNTSGGSAEFSQPTDLTIVSKSGTNQYHGSGFWFLQRDDFNARDTFATTRQKVDANAFGATLGGPLRKDRTFFFFTYEGTRRPQDYLVNTTTIPAPWRSGDLSSISTQILDPLTGQPYPNNKIPVNSVSTKVMDALFPAPTNRSNTSIASPNLTTNFGGDYIQDGYDGRLDHIFNDRHKVFFRYSQKDISNSGTDGSSTYNVNLGARSLVTGVANIAGNHNWIVRPNLINEFRLGYSFANYTTAYPFTAGSNDFAKSLGITGLPPFPARGGAPDFEVSGFLGGILNSVGAPRDIDNRTVDINDAITWIKGAHTIKGGFEFRRYSYRDQITFGGGEEYGTYQFTGQVSGAVNPALSGTVNSLVDFLLGLPVNVQVAQNGPDGKPFGHHYGGYIQDDWKVTRNLTFNLGLRYEVNPAFDDETNQLGNFDRFYPGGRIVAQDLSLINPQWRIALGSTPFVSPSEAGLPHTLRNTYWGNIQPRAGFAWKPVNDLKTVIRGSAGVYSVPVLGSVLYSLLGVNTSNFLNFDYSPSKPIILPNLASGSTSVAPYPGFRRANQTDLRIPRVVQYSISVDRNVCWQTLLRFNYTGSFSENLIYSPDLNQVRPNTVGYAALVATPELRRQNLRFPNFREVLTRDNGPVADYNAFQIEVTRHFASGLTFQNSYTLASNKTNALGSAPNSFAPNGERGLDRSGDNGGNVLNYFDIGSDYGNAAFTRRHRFVSTFVYDLPFGRNRHFLGNISTPLNHVVGGWKLTGITLLQSGPFLTPTFTGTDPSGTAPSSRSVSSFMRPDCIAGVNPLASNPSRSQWLSPAAFAVPASNIGRFGNCGVGIMEGPGTQNFSASIGKRFSLTERVAALYEAQISNVFNITNLGIPNTQINSGSFGRITSTQAAEQAGARTIQMTLRLKF